MILQQQKDSMKVRNQIIDQYEIEYNPDKGGLNI